jgi:hypothetical protein
MRLRREAQAAVERAVEGVGLIAPAAERAAASHQGAAN